MPHPPPRRRSGAGNETDHRLFAARGFYQRGAFLLGGAADLANHHDRLGLVVGEKHLQYVNKIEPVNRIAADADAARLAEPGGGRLRHRLVGQGARARDDADAASAMNVAGHDANLAFVGSDDPRAVRPDQRTLRAVERAFHPHHVEDRDTLGDAHHQLDARIYRFENRIGGEGRRHIDHGRGGACFGTRLVHRVEHRQVEMLGAALSRGHAADHFCAVGDRLLGMEGTLRAGKALTNHRGAGIDDDRHQAASRIASTTFFAASSNPSAAIKGSPDWLRMRRPNSTLVPSRRTTSGTCKLTSRAAETMPSAITSQRMMPPKMLTRIASTLGSERISLNAIVTRSFVAPPPTSRKFAGLPPNSLMMSIVAMASPAPLTMQPILPSSLT